MHQRSDRRKRSSQAVAAAASEGATSDKRCPRTGDKVDAIVDSDRGTQRDLSVTIGTRGGSDIPGRLYDDVAAWMDDWVVRGVVSLERGDLHGHLHIQGILTMGMLKNYGDEPKEQAALRKKIRVDNGWTAEDKVKITIKRLQRNQTFSSE